MFITMEQMLDQIPLESVQSNLEDIPEYETKSQALHTAVINGELRTVRKLMNPKSLALSKDKIGATTLHNAILYRQIDIVQFILKHCPEVVNVQDEAGRTPLHYAGNIQDGGYFYKCLLEAGADSTIEDEEGHTPEYIFSQNNGTMDLLDWRPCTGLDLSPREQTDFPFGCEILIPATIACIPEDEILELVEQGDISLLEQMVLNGQGGRLWGITAEDDDVNEFLAKIPDCISQIDHFHTAIKTGALQQVEELLNNNGKLGLAKDVNGQSPIHTAILYQQTDIIQYLLHKCPECVKLQDQDGRTSLHYAAAVVNGVVNYYNLLIENGADPNVADKDDKTPAYFLDHQSELDLTQLKGRKSNIQVMRFEHEEASTIENALKGTSQYNDINYLEQMVLDGHGRELLGQISENPDIEEFLECVPIYLSKIEALHAAVNSGSFREVKMMLDRKKLVHAKDATGACPLHNAVLHKHYKIVRYLVNEYPQCIDTTDHEGRTPLHYAAAINDKQQSCKILLEAGANPTIKDKYGHTAEYYVENPDMLDYKALLEKNYFSYPPENCPGNMSSQKPHLEELTLEQVQELLLKGRGEQMIGLSSNNENINEYLQNIPQLMNQIESLHLSISEGNLQKLQSILDNPKFILAQDRAGAFPIHNAVLYKQMDILKYILENFSECVNVQDHWKYTPLHYAGAIQNGDEYFRLLSDAGGDSSITDMCGKTAGYYLCHPGELDVQRLLNKDELSWNLLNKQWLTEDQTQLILQGEKILLLENIASTPPERTSENYMAKGSIKVRDVNDTLKTLDKIDETVQVSEEITEIIKTITDMFTKQTTEAIAILTNNGFNNKIEEEIVIDKTRENTAIEETEEYISINSMPDISAVINKIPVSEKTKVNESSNDRATGETNNDQIKEYPSSFEETEISNEEASEESNNNQIKEDADSDETKAEIAINEGIIEKAREGITQNLSENLVVDVLPKETITQNTMRKERLEILAPEKETNEDIIKDLEEEIGIYLSTEAFSNTKGEQILEQKPEAVSNVITDVVKEKENVYQNAMEIATNEEAKEIINMLKETCNVQIEETNLALLREKEIKIERSLSEKIMEENSTENRNKEKFNNLGEETISDVSTDEACYAMKEDSISDEDSMEIATNEEAKEIINENMLKETFNVQAEETNLALLRQKEIKIERSLSEKIMEDNSTENRNKEKINNLEEIISNVSTEEACYAMKEDSISEENSMEEETMKTQEAVSDDAAGKTDTIKEEITLNKECITQRTMGKIKSKDETGNDIMKDSSEEIVTKVAEEQHLYDISEETIQYENLTEGIMEDSNNKEATEYNIKMDSAGKIAISSSSEDGDNSEAIKGYLIEEIMEDNITDKTFQNGMSNSVTSAITEKILKEKQFVTKAEAILNTTVKEIATSVSKTKGIPHAMIKEENDIESREVNITGESQKMIINDSTKEIATKLLSEGIVPYYKPEEVAINHRNIEGSIMKEIINELVEETDIEESCEIDEEILKEKTDFDVTGEPNKTDSINEKILEDIFSSDEIKENITKDFRKKTVISVLSEADARDETEEIIISKGNTATKNDAIKCIPEKTVTELLPEAICDKTEEIIRQKTITQDIIKAVAKDIKEENTTKAVIEEIVPDTEEEININCYVIERKLEELDAEKETKESINNLSQNIVTEKVAEYIMAENITEVIIEEIDADATEGTNIEGYITELEELDAGKETKQSIRNLSEEIINELSNKQNGHVYTKEISILKDDKIEAIIIEEIENESIETNKVTHHLSIVQAVPKTSEDTVEKITTNEGRKTVMVDETGEIITKNQVEKSLAGTILKYDVIEKMSETSAEIEGRIVENKSQEANTKGTVQSRPDISEANLGEVTAFERIEENTLDGAEDITAYENKTVKELVSENIVANIHIEESKELPIIKYLTEGIISDKARKTIIEDALEETIAEEPLEKYFTGTIMKEEIIEKMAEISAEVKEENIVKNTLQENAPKVSVETEVDRIFERLEENTLEGAEDKISKVLETENMMEKINNEESKKITILKDPVENISTVQYNIDVIEEKLTKDNVAEKRIRQKIPYPTEDNISQETNTDKIVEEIVNTEVREVIIEKITGITSEKANRETVMDSVKNEIAFYATEVKKLIEKSDETIADRRNRPNEIEEIVDKGIPEEIITNRIKRTEIEKLIQEVINGKSVKQTIDNDQSENENDNTKKINEKTIITVSTEEEKITEDETMTSEIIEDISNEETANEIESMKISKETKINVGTEEITLTKENITRQMVKEVVPGDKKDDPIIFRKEAICWDLKETKKITEDTITKESSGEERTLQTFNFDKKETRTEYIEDETLHAKIKEEIIIDGITDQTTLEKTLDKTIQEEITVEKTNEISKEINDMEQTIELKEESIIQETLTDKIGSRKKEILQDEIIEETITGKSKEGMTSIKTEMLLQAITDKSLATGLTKNVNEEITEGIAIEKCNNETLSEMLTMDSIFDNMDKLISEERENESLIENSTKKLSQNLRYDVFSQELFSRYSETKAIDESSTNLSKNILIKEKERESCNKIEVICLQTFTQDSPSKNVAEKVSIMCLEKPEMNKIIKEINEETATELIKKEGFASTQETLTDNINKYSTECMTQKIQNDIIVEGYERIYKVSDDLLVSEKSETDDTINKSNTSPTVESLKSLILDRYKNNATENEVINKKIIINIPSETEIITKINKSINTAMLNGSIQNEFNATLQNIEENASLLPKTNDSEPQTETGKYLMRALGDVLLIALAEVAEYRPFDPIDHLAQWLYKYGENVKIYKNISAKNHEKIPQKRFKTAEGKDNNLKHSSDLLHEVMVKQKNSSQIYKFSSEKRTDRRDALEETQYNINENQEDKISNTNLQNKSFDEIKNGTTINQNIEELLENESLQENIIKLNAEHFQIDKGSNKDTNKLIKMEEKLNEMTEEKRNKTNSEEIKVLYRIDEIENDQVEDMREQNSLVNINEVVLNKSDSNRNEMNWSKKYEAAQKISEDTDINYEQTSEQSLQLQNDIINQFFSDETDRKNSLELVNVNREKKKNEAENKQNSNENIEMEEKVNSKDKMINEIRTLETKSLIPNLKESDNSNKIFISQEDREEITKLMQDASLFDSNKHTSVESSIKHSLLQVPDIPFLSDQKFGMDNLVRSRRGSLIPSMSSLTTVTEEQVDVAEYTKDENGQTELHQAVFLNHTRESYYNLLLQSMYSPAERDGLGQTPRDLAVANDVPEIVAAIDCFVTNLALMMQLEELEQLILDGYEHIADIEDETGKTLTQAAEELEMTELVQLLKNIPLYQEKVHQLNNAIKEGQARKVCNILDRKKLATARDKKGRCSLHIAILYECLDIAEYIVFCVPATAYIKDSLGRTPLHYAMATSKAEEAKSLLLSNGADLDVVDMRGHRPEYYAINNDHILEMRDDAI